MSKITAHSPGVLIPFARHAKCISFCHSTWDINWNNLLFDDLTFRVSPRWFFLVLPNWPFPPPIHKVLAENHAWHSIVWLAFLNLSWPWQGEQSLKETLSATRWRFTFNFLFYTLAISLNFQFEAWPSDLFTFLVLYHRFPPWRRTNPPLPPPIYHRNWER